MNNRFIRRDCAIALLALAGTALSTSTLYAQTIETPDLLVSAGVTPLPTKEVASSFTIIGQKEIKAHQYNTVSEALAGVPGIHIVPQGGEGKVTSVFSRGSNSNQTLVLMNGQDISDPSTPTGAFNFADLTMDSVERIEIVRGPQSAIYGSQAMGGIINIITKTGSGTPTITGRVEGGTRGSLNTSVVSGGSFGKVNYFASIARRATDGSDVTPKRLRGGAAREKDGYENVTGSLKLGAELSENISISVFGQIIDSYSDLDTELPQNLYNRTKNKFAYINGELRGDFFCSNWKPVIALAYSKSNRDDIDFADIYTVTNGLVENEGERFSASFDNSVQLAEWNTLSFGTKFTREKFSQIGFTDFGFGFIQFPDADAEEDAQAFYISDHLTFGENFFLTASLRHDAPDNFKNKTTWSIAPGFYIPETDTKITASYATGFKVPSLFERYGFTPNTFGSAYFGNTLLRPEESEGWEVGFDQGFADGTVKLGATYFSTKFEDPITTIFLPTFDSTTVNAPNFKARGIESYLAFSPSNSLELRADYTFTVVDATRIVAAQSRRPRHKVNLSAIVKPTEATTLSAETEFVAPYLDVNRLTGGLMKPGSYTVVNIAASHQINDWVEITAKVKNLLNRQYEPANGFVATGIEALAGVAITF